MNPAFLLATITFAAGFLSLLGWAYLTTGNPRSNGMVVKSLLLFVLPGSLVVALPESLFVFPLSMWVVIFVEECLKACAARTESKPLNRFWLVALFGLWELALAKPFSALMAPDAFRGWSRVELLGLAAAAGVAALMHIVTAAIYAFHFEGRLWAAFVASLAIHVGFNEAVELFGPSLFACGSMAFVLGLLLVALWLEGRASSPDRAFALAPEREGS